MSDLLKKIDLLEREVEHLTEERRFAMSTLEMVAGMISLDSGPADLIDKVHTLSETATKILSISNFESICFYLINEDDASFYLAYCEPEEYQPELEEIVDQLINDQTFAWALGRNKPVRIENENPQRTLLLHSLATASRTRGMFVGIPIEDADEVESPLPLLTLVLHSCANTLESLELYHKMRQINHDLELNNSELQKRSEDLILAQKVSENADREKSAVIATLKQNIEQSVKKLQKETHILLGTELSSDQIQSTEKLKQLILKTLMNPHH